MRRFSVQLVLAIPLWLALGWSQQPGSITLPSGREGVADLRIVVVDGEDGVNIIKKKTAVKPIVEVRDKNNLPVAGVAVVFLLPLRGASGTFTNGEKQLSLVTDAHGRAAVADFQPSGKGLFNIHVRATFQGKTATATIRQTNFSTVSSALKAGKTPGSSSSAASGSGGASSSASSAAGSAAGAGGAAGAASGGLSGLAIAGIAAGGAAAIGGGLVAGGVIKTSSSTGSSRSCDPNSFVNQMISDLNAEATVCLQANANFSQCQASAQKVLNDAGQACSCSGENAAAELGQYLQTLRNVAAQVHLMLPSSCGF